MNVLFGMNSSSSNFIFLAPPWPHIPRLSIYSSSFYQYSFLRHNVFFVSLLMLWLNSSYWFLGGEWRWQSRLRFFEEKKFFLILFIKLYLISNIVLVSGVQLQIIFHYRLLQDIEYSSMFCIVNLLFLLYAVVYIYGKCFLIRQKSLYQLQKLEVLNFNLESGPILEAKGFRGHLES